MSERKNPDSGAEFIKTFKCPKCLKPNNIGKVDENTNEEGVAAGIPGTYEMGYFCKDCYKTKT